MINPENVFFNMIDKERNIYEHSILHNQNRKSPDEFIQNLKNPFSDNGTLKYENGSVYDISNGLKFPVSENVIDFRNNEAVLNSEEWIRLNKQFLNYHKSLTVYTLLNSMPITNYVSLKSGIGELKNIKVVDVGAGTGHVHGSFFRYPESIEYYLVDPNLRLLHDQFIRFFPSLTNVSLAHVLAYAEHLPFKDGFADLVLSLSAIDHYNHYQTFISEAHRILKPGGKILISSHLDIPAASVDSGNKVSKWLSASFFERVSRYLYYRSNRLGKDDHTYHFKNTEPFTSELEMKGFKILKNEIFKRYFFVVAEKI